MKKNICHKLKLKLGPTDFKKIEFRGKMWPYDPATLKKKKVMLKLWFVHPTAGVQYMNTIVYNLTTDLYTTRIINESQYVLSIHMFHLLQNWNSIENLEFFFWSPWALTWVRVYGRYFFSCWRGPKILNSGPIFY